MSREIKFRAWDSEANIMVYSDHRTRKLYDVYYGFEMNESGLLECRWEGDFTESHVLDGGTLDNIMQYTGLHDKNGKEIYEGDILINRHEEDTGEVVFEDGSFFWETETFTQLLGEINDEIEVIGNIYENPELIE